MDGFESGKQHLHSWFAEESGTDLGGVNPSCPYKQYPTHISKCFVPKQAGAVLKALRRDGVLQVREAMLLQIVDMSTYLAGCAAMLATSPC